MTNTFVSCAAESGRADAFCFHSLYRAWQACRKRKRGTRNAQRYEIHLLDRLVDTHTALEARTWLPGRSVCFVTTRPKAREIHAADFADRVVHHLLVPRLEALFEPVFIHDSYSNRVGKGTHAAVDRVQSFMRRVSRNGTRHAWYLQLDVRNFFNTIDRPLLLDQLIQRIGKTVCAGRLDPIEAEQLGWLCGVILNRHPAENVVYRGDANVLASVPEYKRLSSAPLGKGLPIGNLTSQFFANVYLNELDQFVKHTLKCRCYVRYVDDFVLLHEDRERLLQWRWFKQQRPGDVVLVQRGNVFEAYDEDAKSLSKLLSSTLGTREHGKSPLSLRDDSMDGGGRTKSGTRVERFGVKGYEDETLLSLSLRQLKSFRRRLRAVGVPHCFIAEEGYLKGGMKRRVLRLAWHPQAAQARGVQPCNA